jgi:hypothetical protein
MLQPLKMLYGVLIIRRCSAMFIPYNKEIVLQPGMQVRAVDRLLRGTWFGNVPRVVTFVKTNGSWFKVNGSDDWWIATQQFEFDVEDTDD